MCVATAAASVQVTEFVRLSSANLLLPTTVASYLLKSCKNELGRLALEIVFYCVFQSKTAFLNLHRNGCSIIYGNIYCFMIRHE